MKLVQLGDIKINLFDNIAYKWTIGTKACVRGYIIVNHECLQGEEFLKYVDAIESVEELLVIIKDIEGFFNIITLFGDKVFACVDRLRSMPLFYSNQDKSNVIYDSLGSSAIKGMQLDEEILDTYRCALFTVGNKTIFQDVYQIQAGHWILFEGQEVLQTVYFSMKYACNQICDEKDAIALLDEKYTNTFKRLIQVLNGRTAVVPLSGGHDSRLIAFYLKRLGYNKIIAYSYGEPDSLEMKCSEEVANVLDIPWHAVVYNGYEMNKLFDETYSEFAIMAGNGSSVPCLQEWYAIYVLIKKEVIDKNCVVVPGYTGDFFAGNHLIDNITAMEPITAEKVLNYILRTYCKENHERRLKTEKLLCEYIMEENTLLANKEKQFTVDEANEIVELFDYRNRQSKFIENAVRVYDFFGIQWTTPFFDKEQFDCWAQINNSLRYGRVAFFALEKQVYSSTLQAVPFAKKANMSKWKRRIKYLIKGKKAIHFMYGYYKFGLKYPFLLMTHKLYSVNKYAQEGYIAEVEKYITGSNGIGEIV